MGKTDPRVDAYITKSADFAKPILTHIRKLIHDTCPSVEETIKWSFPHFMYKSPNERNPRILCSMASFKQHCALGFWYTGGGPMSGEPKPAEGMGQYGKITSISDLPKDKELIKQIKEAVKLHQSGIKASPRTRSNEKKELEIPGYFAAALKKNRKALKTFEQFNYTNKKEYVDWVTEAKTEKTRISRLATAVEWMSEGKTHNWRYVKR
ncbi:MAG TPA: YdeI/OmpD-associated family protein [Blastocatellia bacterium]|nr:YdeI/OmpD-associated family protein [Blastocatellia bacterium]